MLLIKALLESVILFISKPILGIDEDEWVKTYVKKRFIVSNMVLFIVGAIVCVINFDSMVIVGIVFGICEALTSYFFVFDNESDKNRIILSIIFAVYMFLLMGRG